jgi:putative transposase
MAVCRWTRQGRLKDLEQENGKVKPLVAELSLDKLVLKDLASGNF